MEMLLRKTRSLMLHMELSKYKPVTLNIWKCLDSNDTIARLSYSCKAQD